MTAVVIRNSWGAQAARTEPFRWAQTAPGDLYSLDVARQLAASMPQQGFTRREEVSATRSKTYRNSSRVLAAPGEAVTQLDGLWRDLVGDLLSRRYRERVAELLGTPAAGAVEVRLVRHLPGDWLGPHTDRPDKVFSHILYFTPGWRREWGGCLEILAGADPGSVVSRVLPELGASALLARSDNSWHQVSPVARERVPTRTSLLVHGIR